MLRFSEFNFSTENVEHSLENGTMKHVRELSIEEWEEAKAKTQFLGQSMSHELGALLLTETINHSIKENNQPVFCLFLDAALLLIALSERSSSGNSFSLELVDIGLSILTIA